MSRESCHTPPPKIHKRTPQHTKNAHLQKNTQTWFKCFQDRTLHLPYFTHKSAQRPTEDKTVSEKIQSPVRILSNQTRATENKAKLIAW